MIIDLKTGETYGALIYSDRETLVMWTDGRESQLPASAQAETVDVEFVGRGVLRRLQLLVVLETALIAARREALADYASRNGGQIAEHREPPPEPPKGVVAGIARLFAPR